MSQRPAQRSTAQVAFADGAYQCDRIGPELTDPRLLTVGDGREVEFKHLSRVIELGGLEPLLSRSGVCNEQRSAQRGVKVGVTAWSADQHDRRVYRGSELYQAFAEIAIKVAR